MSHERMTRSETVEMMKSHRVLAETCINNTDPSPARRSVPQHTYKMEMLAKANAHALLAIFYQGELRETP